MINLLWMAMFAVGVLFAFTQGTGGAQMITESMIEGAGHAVTFGIGLIGILAFWNGMMKIVEAAGITDAIGRLLAPLIRRLFPSIPEGHPANASILMSVVANMIGIGHAATPLGIKAMQDLKTLSKDDQKASDAMCTFAILCTSGLTIIPATVIAMRAAAGSTDPAIIVGPTIVATLASTVAALLFDRLFRQFRRRRST